MLYVWAILVLIILFGVSIAAYFVWEKWSKGKKVEEAFEGRKPLTAEELRESEFSDQRVSLEVIERVRKVLESELDTDLSRLRTSDDFSKNLSFFEDYDSMATVNLVYALEEEFGVSIKDEEAEKMVTFRDIVLTMSGKLQPKH